MEMVGVWIALAGMVIAFVAIYFYCSCRNLSEKKDRTIGFFVWLGCGLIAAGGVRILYVTCYLFER